MGRIARMKRGYFKHWRKMVDWPWRSQPNFYSVWGYLLEMGAGLERYELFEGKRILLKPGQLVTGRKIIAKKTGIHQSSVQRILSRLEIEQQIEQQTGAKSRLITILNWQDYHGGEHQSEPQVNHRRTTGEPQVNTGLEVKKLEKGENGKDKYPVDFNMFWSVYPKKTAKQTALRAWNKLGSSRPSVVGLVEAIEEQKTWDKWRQGFIYNPATWLNGHCWEDEKPDEPEPPKSDYQKRMERIEDEYNKGN